VERQATQWYGCGGAPSTLKLCLYDQHCEHNEKLFVGFLAKMDSSRGIFYVQKHVVFTIL